MNTTTNRTFTLEDMYMKMIQMCAETIRDFSTPPPTPGNDNQESGEHWICGHAKMINAYGGTYWTCPVLFGDSVEADANGDTKEQAEANARLIASAPDMFRFIKEMAERYANSEWIAGEANKLINSITGGKETIN